MDNSTGIDWLAFTLPSVCHSLAAMSAVAANLFPLLPMDWHDEKPRNGYRVAAKSEQSGIVIMSGSSSMGTHVIVPGQSMRWIEKMGISAPGLFANMRKLDAKPTRIDLALDMRGDDTHAVLWFAQRIKLGYADYESHTYAIIESQEGGYTLYLGSRTSARFARIYNKAAEVLAKTGEAIQDDWVRIELELHGDQARKVPNMVAAGQTIDLIVRSMIAGYMDFKHPDWQRIIGEDTTPIEGSTRRLPNARTWLLETVAPSLARVYLTDPDFMKEFTEAVLAAAERQQSGA